MKRDIGDRLLAAFARRRPWRFAFMMYCIGFFGVVFAEDVVLGHRLPGVGRYWLSLSLASPFIWVASSRVRAAIGRILAAVLRVAAS